MIIEKLIPLYSRVTTIKKKKQKKTTIRHALLLLGPSTMIKSTKEVKLVDLKISGKIMRN